MWVSDQNCFWQAWQHPWVPPGKNIDCRKWIKVTIDSNLLADVFNHIFRLWVLCPCRSWSNELLISEDIQGGSRWRWARKVIFGNVNSICFSLKRLLPLRTVYTSLFSTGLHLQNSLLKVTFCFPLHWPESTRMVNTWKVSNGNPLFRCATWKASLTAWRKGEGRATAWVQSCLMRNRFQIE